MNTTRLEEANERNRTFKDRTETLHKQTLKNIRCHLDSTQTHGENIIYELDTFSRFTTTKHSGFRR